MVQWQRPLAGELLPPRVQSLGAAQFVEKLKKTLASPVCQSKETAQVGFMAVCGPDRSLTGYVSQCLGGAVVQNFSWPA
jgi:hypothetical protein